jgi:hypothetical protein
MDRKTLNRVGLAAAILLVPGGLILGAGLAARHYRKRADETPDPSKVDRE